MWKVIQDSLPVPMRQRKQDARKKDAYDEEDQQQQQQQPIMGRRGDVGTLPGHHQQQPPHPQQAYAAQVAAAARAEVVTRCKPQLAWSVGVVFLLLPFLAHYADPPQAIWKLLMVAVLGVLGYQILTFRRWSDEFPYVLRFLACFSIMIVELLWENCMVWIVSATDLRKYDDPPGLQDNGEIVFNFLADKNALLSWFINGKWCETIHFLGVVLCHAFSVAWDQHPFSGFGVMSRFCLTIFFSRILRVVSFMSTVLPSPRSGCYRKRFPPPPDTWWAILVVGMRQLRGFGGCNDLVFSGHGALWVLAPLVLQTYYASRSSTALLWVALFQASIRDVIDRQHYSVDMFLAVVVTWGVWNALEWVYPETQPLPQRPQGAVADKPHPLLLGGVGLGLACAAIVIFVAKA